MKEVYIFKFDEDVDSGRIEALIVSAIRNAEHYFGKPKVRLNVSYFVSENSAIINVVDEVGEFILKVFTGNASDKIGEKRFRVERKQSNGKEHHGTV